MSAPTHEDWENAKAKRELVSRKIVNATLRGESDLAENFAKQWMVHDNEMLAISNVLDGEG